MDAGQINEQKKQKRGIHNKCNIKFGRKSMGKVKPIRTPCADGFFR